MFAVEPVSKMENVTVQVIKKIVKELAVVK